MLLKLSETDRKILITILDKYRDHFDFFAFGSRVTGSAKKYSDLDLAIIVKRPLSLSSLRSELEESNISITVDLVNLDDISHEFKEHIQKQMIQI